MGVIRRRTTPVAVPQEMGAVADEKPAPPLVAAQPVITPSEPPLPVACESFLVPHVCWTSASSSGEASSTNPHQLRYEDT
jgi:hypothetical protein